MTRRVSVFLVLAIIVTGTIALPVVAENPTPKTASVTINEYINLTVTDYGTAGINFGTLNSGMTDQPEKDQQSNGGAVKLQIGSDTNVVCNVQMKGEGDFRNSTGQTIPLGNVKWEKSNSPYTASPMTTSYTTVFTSSVGAIRAENIYYWISIPSSQAAGTYTTTFLYQAVKQ